MFKEYNIPVILITVNIIFDTDAYKMPDESSAMLLCLIFGIYILFMNIESVHNNMNIMLKIMLLLIIIIYLPAVYFIEIIFCFIEFGYKK